MKRATVSIPDDVAIALKAYLEDEQPTPPLTAVIHDALADFLADRGYLPGKPRRLKLTVARGGSGTSTTSIDHDAAFAE